MQHYLHETTTRERVAAMTGWTHFNAGQTPPGRREQALSGALWHPIPCVTAAVAGAAATPSSPASAPVAGNGTSGDGVGVGGVGGGGGAPLPPAVLSLAAHRPAGTSRVPFAVAAAGDYTPAAVGEPLGPAWATVWFRVDLALPPWLAALPAGGGAPAAAGHTCPPGLDDRLCLVWDAGAEALVWSADGRPRQGLVGGDGLCSRADYSLGEDIAAAVAAAAAGGAGGDTIAPLPVRLYVEVACNGLFGVGAGGDIEPPDGAKTFVLSRAALALRCETAWSLVHDLTALGGMADALPAGAPQRRAALSAANNLVNAVVVRDLGRSAAGASTAASSFWASSPPAPGASTPTVAAVGHCHIDTAWLWVLAEARRKVARSWSSQLRLLEEYPTYVFAASQALHYAWMEEAYPSLMAEVGAAIRRGGWAPVGGTWVEMDTNIPCGEALVRQFTVGQAYFGSRLGGRARTLWLPDTFGYAPQLPQLAVSAGIGRFLTQKLSWNRWTNLPHSSFWWVGLDGSRLLTHCPPADNYCSTAEAGDLVKSVTGNKTAPWVNGSMLLYGHGDGGGGPSPAMLESLSRFEGVDGMPRVRLAGPDAFFDEVAKAGAAMDGLGGLPSHFGELYLQLHRGTLTSQAATKRGNAAAESALLTADLVTALAATVAAAAGGGYKYPAEELGRLWRLVLTHAFHDTLPGSSIAAVYEEAEADYATVVASTGALVAAALGGGFALPAEAVAAPASPSAAPRPPPPAVLPGLALLVSAPPPDAPVLRLPRSVAAAALPADAVTQVAGPPVAAAFAGAPFTDTLHAGTADDDVLVLSSTAPAGVGLFPFGVATAAAPGVPPVTVEAVSPASGGGFAVANGRVAAHIDACGLLRRLSVTPSAADGGTAEPVEVIAAGGAGNRLVVYDDALQFWDAWDTSVAGREKPCATDEAAVVTLTAVGPLRVTVHVAWPRLLPAAPPGKAPAAAAQQWLTLDAASSRLDVAVAVDWATPNRQLLRLQVDTAFPTATTFAAGVQFGWVPRPAHANTPADAAQFEGVGQRYADVSAYGGGVALLSDCRYGYSADAGSGRLWLSLLRSPRSPDPRADVGRVHIVRMALVPHAAAWPVAAVPAAADALCAPPTVVPVPPGAIGAGPRTVGVTIEAGSLPSVRIGAVKLADALSRVPFPTPPASPVAGGGGAAAAPSPRPAPRRPLVVRAYEALGGTGAVRLRVSRSLGRLVRAVATNILEDVDVRGRGGGAPPPPPTGRPAGAEPRGPLELPVAAAAPGGDGLVAVRFGAFQVRTLLLYFAP